MSETETIVRDDEERMTTIREMITLSKDYRSKFIDTWNKIENQLNGVHPDNWDKKEAWQTKCFTRVQKKASETAMASMKKILFPSKRFFAFDGIDKDDREFQNDIATAFEVLLSEGDFYVENTYVLNEGIDCGTSFIKVLADKDKGFTFSRRQVRKCFVDPIAVTNFSKSRFWGEEYDISLFELLEDKRIPEDKKTKLLQNLSEKTGDRTDDPSLIYSGNSYHIAKLYYNIVLTEFWGRIPFTVQKDVGGQIVEYKDVEDRNVLIANDLILLIDLPNPYPGIPVFPLKVKRRKYDFYGYGFLEGGIELQEKFNSDNNLGSDAMKLSAFDIILLDDDAIKDESSIRYGPKEMWRMKKGRVSDSVNRFQQSRNIMPEVIQSNQFIDSMHQDVTGVTRHAQGTGMLGGSGSGSETLGEYELKLQAVAERFLDVARDIEEDYINPMLNFMFEVMTSPKFIDFYQEKMNRILGFKVARIINAETGEETQEKTEVPKINLRTIGQINLDFKSIALTNFIQRTQGVQKLKAAMELVAKIPQAQQLIKWEKLLGLIFQWVDVPDYKDFLNTDMPRPGIGMPAVPQLPGAGGMAGIPQPMPQMMGGMPNG
jgi:hypothetical protein